MNLIDRIAYLRALDPDQVWSVEDYMQIVEMLPGLLAALDFQPGDAEVLKRVADNEEQMAKFVAGFGKPDMSTANVLRRYQAMAERMEATCHT